MSNTFLGAQVNFHNISIHFLLNEIMTFRKQLTSRDECKNQSGWGNALNTYMVVNIEKLNDTIRRCTYNPENLTQDELEVRSADTTINIADMHNALSLSIDNVVAPSGPPTPIVWDLTGTDLDIPQLTQLNCPNETLRSFVTGLDRVFTEATRVDSRSNYATINKSEGTMLVALLGILYTITQDKGGEINRTDIPNGTLPSQEGGTFQGA